MSVASPVRTEFRAMGTECDIVIHGGQAGLDVLGELAVRELEASWSRFRADSELSELNAAAGSGAVPASPTMRVLVRTMISAWQLSGGLCDATVLDAVVNAGYDTDFDVVAARPSAPTAHIAEPPPGLTGVEVGRSWVSLPAGVHLDPGAMGKGLAADLVAGRLIAAGATGCSVNIGGDVVLSGRPADETPWVVAVDDARNPGTPLLGFELPEGGAVATSSTVKRRWAEKHHVIDPRTGDSAHTDLCQVTVIADSGWWAETAATAALILGHAQAVKWLGQRALHGLLVSTEGTVMEV